jgi:hypothetical protein
MIITVRLFAAGITCLALVIRELHKAPEGYEDELGFHVFVPFNVTLEKSRLIRCNISSTNLDSSFPSQP